MKEQEGLGAKKKQKEGLGAKKKQVLRKNMLGFGSKGENAPEGMLEGTAGACCKCLQAAATCREHLQAPVASTCEHPQAPASTRKRPRVTFRPRPPPPHVPRSADPRPA